MSVVSAKRFALLASIFGSGIVFLDSTIVNVALPAIRAGLRGGLAEQQWVVEAYLLTLSSLLLVGGSLGDRLGRRRVFSAGLVGFGVCSLACALAPSSAVLIAARAVQGLAGALLVPNTLALLVDCYPESERPGAIGSWTAWTGISTVIGPLGGGALVQLASWRWIFAINVPAVVATLWLLRRTGDDQREPGHIDVTGAILCAIGLGGPVFALIEQPSYGWSSPVVLAPLGVGVTVLAAFFLWERRVGEPMLPLRLFAVRNFTVSNAVTLALYAGLSTSTFLLVLFIQQVGGYTPIQAGLSLLPITILIFALSRRTGALAARAGPRRFLAGGPFVAGAGLLLLARTGQHAEYVGQILPGVLVFGLGMAGTVAPLTATVLGSVEPGHSGVASGVNNAVARVAGLLAIAAIGAVVSAAFADRVMNQLAGAGPAVRHAIATVRSRPLVVTVTSGVPRAERALVKHALSIASLGAFRIGIVIAGSLALLGGLLALIGIRNPRLASPDSGEAGLSRFAAPSLTASSED